MKSILENFNIFCPNFDLSLREYNPLVFAYVGDAVYTLFVRSMLASTTLGKSGMLHKTTSKIVSANEQSKTLDYIFNILTEKEKELAKKTRNIHTQTKAKNANLENYKKSSSFEAILGWLYMNKNFDRLNEILNISVKFAIEDNSNN